MANQLNALRGLQRRPRCNTVSDFTPSIRSRTSTPNLTDAGDSDDDDDFPSEVITPERILLTPFDMYSTKSSMRSVDDAQHLVGHVSWRACIYASPYNTDDVSQEQIVGRYEREAKLLELTAENSWKHYSRTRSEVDRFEKLSTSLKQFLNTCEDCHWQIENLDSAVEHLRLEVQNEAETMRQTVATLYDRIPEAKKKLEDMRRKRAVVDEIVKSAEDEVTSMLKELGIPDM